MKKGPRGDAGPEVKAENSYNAEYSSATSDLQAHTDLAAEFAACALPDDAARTRLRRQGVPEMAIWSWPGPVYTSRIETHPMGMFDFADAGQRAYVMRVLTGPAFGDIGDLIAWHTGQPDRWWTRCYSGLPLGIDHLDRAEFDQTPIVLHPTPLDWLRAGGAGAVVTDWLMTAPQLRRIPSIICEDREFGTEAQRRLTMPRFACPEIRVVKQEVAA